jgi:hypothetical protein
MPFAVSRISKFLFGAAAAEAVRKYPSFAAAAA